MLVANVFTICGASIFLIFGLAYLYKSISINNHCNSIQENIRELNIQNKTFLFALMRGVAGGAITLAITLIYLQLQYFKYASPWIPLIILIGSSIFFLSAIDAMLLVKRKTTVKPPILALVLAIVLILVGYLINISVVDQVYCMFLQ